MHDTASQKNAQLYNEQFLKVLKQEKSSNAKEIADWKSFFFVYKFPSLYFNPTPINPINPPTSLWGHLTNKSKYHFYSMPYTRRIMDLLF